MAAFCIDISTGDAPETNLSVPRNFRQASDQPENKFPNPIWNPQKRNLVSSQTDLLRQIQRAASDKPFQSINEMTANLGAILIVPARNDRDSWQFMLMYMYGGAINIPFPMVSYQSNISDTLHINIGLPLSIEWQPADEWSINLSYVPLNNINAQAKYNINNTMRIHSGYEYLNESYLLTDRLDNQDRFFVFEQRLVTGFQWDVRQYITFELNGGYSFGRYFAEGQSQWGTLYDRVDVDPGPFLGANLRMRF